MSKRTKPSSIKILYIDDEVEDYERLQIEANVYCIELTHETNLEEGIVKFKEKKGEQFFDGIILDALCRINKEDSIPNRKHTVTALKEFHALAPSLHKVIFTGETAFAHELTGLIEVAETPIFNKGDIDDVRSMLTKFVDDSKHKEDRKIAQRFADVFKIVEKHMGSAKEELIRCIKNMNGSDVHTIKGNLGCIRSVVEKMFFALHGINKELIPDDCAINTKTKRPEINFASIMYHLNGCYKDGSHQGKIYIEHESNIDRQFVLVYRGCSEGIHAFEEDTAIKPTRYTVQSITYALMDLILWMDAVIKRGGR